MVEVVSRHQMKRGRLLRYLEELAGAGVRATLYVPPGVAPAAVAADGPAAAPLAALGGVSLPSRAAETGAVLFLGEETFLVVPPFPLAAGGAYHGYRPEPLRELLARDRLVGIVLLRLGGFSIGVFEGERLLDAKTDTRFVKGRHRAGGQSQRRFERIREKQIQELFDEACGVARTKFGPVERRLEHIFLGGERHTLGAFRRRCRYLEGLADRIAPRILNAPEPKREVLEQMAAEVWKSEVAVLRGGGPAA
ncbi:MAG TPA: acVLRF1 family peptidyl-tRNA hydrolase [Dehalococcoidia bacterium]